jgi:PAS domain S-box-containing protein
MTQMHDKFSVLVHPEDIPHLADNLAQSRRLEDGEIHEFECRVRRRDGEWRWVAARSMVFARNAQGEVRQTVNAAFDVTERKHAEDVLRRAHAELEQRVRERTSQLTAINAELIREITEPQEIEQTLQEHQQRLRVALESAAVAFTILRAVRDESARIRDFAWLYVNPAASRIFGRAPTELIGRRVLEVLPGGWDPPGLFACFVHVVESGESRDIEVASAHDGISGWFHNIAAKLGDGLAVWFTNVTERRRAEEHLRRSEAYLVEGQRLSHTGSWAWNISTGELFWSLEHFRICGVDPEQLTLTIETAQQLIHPEDRAAVNHTFYQAIRDRTDCEGDFRLVRPDGTLRDVHSVAHPVFNASGELTEFVGTLIDTTERRRAEAEVRRAYATLEQQVRERTAALAHANAELRAEITERRRAKAALARQHQELLALYARVEQDRALQATLLQELNHRVRNNLAAIIGILEVGRARAHRRTADEALATCAAWVKAIARAHDVLAAGVFAPMDLRDFIAVVAEGIMWQAEVGAPQIAIIYDGASMLLPPKPFLALACITNELILNAVKHAFRGRTHGRIEIRAWNEEDQYVLEVRDDGIGSAAGAEAVGSGLEIVATLCRTDLRGDCSFQQDGGAIARIAFPKGVAAAGAEP